MGASLSDHSSPPVGTVVVNWCAKAETLDCLRALPALRYPNWSLTLIDNGCEDFSSAEIEQLIPHSHYLRTETNLGFAGGANLGMHAALHAGAEFVWFLNNDALPDPAALTELLIVARRPGVGIVGAKILQREHPERLDSIALQVDLRSGRVFLIGHDELDHGNYDQLDAPSAVTGCAMLVSRAICERLGGFDESFFSYLEDADLCLRAREAGFGVAVAPRARVLHKRLPATKGRQSVASLYYTTRNHLRLIDRHSRGPAWQRRLRTAFIVALSAAYALRAGGVSKRQHLHAVWCGIRDYRRGVVGAGETNYQP